MDSEFKDFFSVLVSIFSHTLFSLLFRLCLWFMNSDRYRKKQAEENIANDEKLSAAASGGICRAKFPRWTRNTTRNCSYEYNKKKLIKKLDIHLNFKCARRTTCKVTQAEFSELETRIYFTTHEERFTRLFSLKSRGKTDETRHQLESPEWEVKDDRKLCPEIA